MCDKSCILFLVRNRNISLTCQKGITDLEQNIPTADRLVIMFLNKKYNIHLNKEFTGGETS